MTTSARQGGLLNRIGKFLSRATKPDSIGGRVLSFRGSAAGIAMTPDEALKVSAVWACINYLGRTVGQLPWRVYSNVKSGKKRISPQHPVDWLLHKRPNPEMSAMQFKQTMVGWAALNGNAIAEIEWDLRGVPRALWPIHPSRVSFSRDPESMSLRYEIMDGVGNIKAILSTADVLHLVGYGDGPIGMSAVDYAADSLGWVRATEIFGAAMFGKGARPSGIVKTKRRLSPDGLAALKSDFAQLYVGPRNAANVMFLDSDMEWLKLDEATGGEFIETRQHQIEEVCRWFGVPPHKVQHLMRATFSNIEHQSIEVVVDSITPWAIKLEQEADAKLFGARSSFYSKLDLNGLMRGDFKSRTDGYKALWSMGVLSTNEIRALEDWDSIGPEGDKRVVPMNMTTLEQLGEQPENTGGLKVDLDSEDEDGTQGEREGAGKGSGSADGEVAAAQLVFDRGAR